MEIMNEIFTIWFRLSTHRQKYTTLCAVPICLRDVWLQQQQCFIWFHVKFYHRWNEKKNNKILNLNDSSSVPASHGNKMTVCVRSCCSLIIFFSSRPNRELSCFFLPVNVSPTRNDCYVYQRIEFKLLINQRKHYYRWIDVTCVYGVRCMCVIKCKTNSLSILSNFALKWMPAQRHASISLAHFIHSDENRSNCVGI